MQEDKKETRPTTWHNTKALVEKLAGKGLSLHRQETVIEIAGQLQQQGMPIEQIALITDLPESEIKAL